MTQTKYFTVCDEDPELFRPRLHTVQLVNPRSHTEIVYGISDDQYATGPNCLATLFGPQPTCVTETAWGEYTSLGLARHAPWDRAPTRIGRLYWKAVFRLKSGSTIHELLTGVWYVCK